MSTETVLVTGGAGYIGSHTTMALSDSGYTVVVLDDLSTGNQDVIPSDCAFIKGNAGDQTLVTKIVREHKIDAVIHFAGSIIVEESVSNPLKYYSNNTMVSRNLIETCVNENIKHFIFSSTAAVYGNPIKVPVMESDQLAPINPYGHSKAMTEQVLKDVSQCTSLNYIALRYFNVSGADPQGRSGQIIKQATHLIKVACELAVGKREGMTIFGNDYDTADGTCVRDYIHVSDLADVHVRALQYLQSNNNESRVLNCGYGKGYSVKEVLDTLQKIIGESLNISQGGRRAGDPALLIADNSLLRSLMDWTPKYNNLENIVRDALEWEKRLLNQK